MKQITVFSVFIVGVCGATAPASAQSVFNFALEPSQEVPPNQSNSAGAAALTFDTVTNTYDLDLFVVGIPLDMLAGAGPNGTSVHIHRAPVGVNGPIVVDVGLFGSFFEDGDGIRLQLQDILFGGVQGNLTSDPVQNEADLFAGNLYLNVHTHEFMGGQIRGQIIPEPTTLGLLAVGLAGLAAHRRKMKRRP